MYRIAGKFGRDKLWRICSFWAFGGKKFGEWIDLAIGLWTVTTNLDGFSLANQRRFAKFAKLSPCQIFPLYSMFWVPVHYCCLVHLGSTVDWNQPSFWEIPDTTTVRWGYIGLWYTTVARSVSCLSSSHTAGELVLVPHCFRPSHPQGWHKTVSSQLLARQIWLSQSNHTNPVRSRGAHPRWCSRLSCWSVLR